MTEDAALRRRVMQAVRSEHTKPEMLVRRLIHRLGYRYRLHRRDLPGKPDLVFVSRHRAIFVNGCFWHGHECARGARPPKTNTEYWRSKIQRNVERDAANQLALEASGWHVLVVWECETRDSQRLERMLRKFL
jgi:DNA mismatch endonuclease (patch repair protein)